MRRPEFTSDEHARQNVSHLHHLSYKSNFLISLRVILISKQKWLLIFTLKYNKLSALEAVFWTSNVMRYETFHAGFYFPLKKLKAQIGACKLERLDRSIQHHRRTNNRLGNHPRFWKLFVWQQMYSTWKKSRRREFRHVILRMKKFNYLIISAFLMAFKWTVDQMWMQAFTYFFSSLKTVSLTFFAALIVVLCQQNNNCNNCLH